MITYNKNIIIPTELQVKSGLERVIKNLYSTYGKDIKIMIDPDYSIKDKTQLCRIMRDYYKEILKLPRKQAVDILRITYSEN